MCPQCASPYIACTFAPLPPYSLVCFFCLPPPRIWLWGRERGERGAGCAVVGLHFRCLLPGSIHHMDRNVCGHPQWTAVRLRPSTTWGWTYGSTWHLCHTAQCLPEELFILLQSVVMACQEKDVEALRVLQKELWPLLDKNQNDILHLLICETGHPSGLGY
uniref:uncharacterized protein isoform X1 n=2 Tax=Myxine glutinosa TaxID=7769 RepID=UPI00358FD2E6